MLGAGQDEDRDAEDQGQVLADLVGVGLIAVHRDVDQHVAEHAQHEKAAQAVGVLRGDEPLGRLGVGAGEAGAVHQRRHGQGADQVADPDHHQGAQIGRLVLQDVAGLAREQVEAVGADGEQADGEKHRAQGLVGADQP